jgi:hypothetical protein
MSWYATGIQDCQNVFSIDEFEGAIDEHANEGANAIVDAVLGDDEAWAFESWMEQNQDDFDSEFHARDAYKDWKAGWRSCAIRAVEAELARRRQQTEQFYLVSVSHVAVDDQAADEEVIEVFTDLDDALDELERVALKLSDADMRAAGMQVKIGNLDGPEETVAWVGNKRKVLGYGGYVADVALWRERKAKRNPTPLRVNSWDQKWKENPVFWLTEWGEDPEQVIERFDYLEDALNEMQRLGGNLYIMAGNHQRPILLAAFWTQNNGRHIAGANDWRDQVEAWRNKPKQNGRRMARKNPTEDTKRAAVGKYKEFWRQEPTKVGEFPSSFKIPTRMHKLGKAIHVLYESLKTDPETLKKPKKPLAYIHEHDFGVQICDTQGPANTDIPDFIVHAPALVCLGQCIGFAWFGDDDGEKHEAEGTDPLPDLWCTVDGRALLVVQSRRKVLQIIWGGSLGVEARGIVG